MSLLSRRALLAAAAGGIAKTRISALTDEVGASEGDAIAFCRQYGLGWVELRNVPGTKTGYWTLPVAEQRAFARRLQDAGLRVSFIDSGLLAAPLPGSSPIKTPGPQEADRFARRMEELDRVLTLAREVGCDKVRCFGGRRVQAPESVFTQLADVLGPMVEVAEKARVRLLLENESSCNVMSCQEIADFVRLIPNTWFGLNWDPGNAVRVEKAYPDGYRLLPVGRIGNVQVKGKGILPGGPDPVDWAGILGALSRDGYTGHVGLETHTANRQADSHPAMQALLRLAVRT